MVNSILKMWVAGASSGLYLNHWHIFLKFHPGYELLGTFWALFESLTCFHEILSRLWVAGHLLGSIWITDMLSWNPTQAVSCWAPLGHHLNYWHASMKSYPECELLGTIPGSIWITDMLPWNPIQDVSCWALPKLYLNYWHLSMKPHLGCELLGTSQALFESLTYIYEIPSRLWVAGHFPSSIWITDILFWNPI